jgi:sugar phosphate isomerase/epimerase
MPITLNDRSFRRRDFLIATASVIAAAGVNTKPLAAADSGDSTRVPLGLDGHSLRGMKWKATQLIEFAAEQRLDAVLLNSLNYFESLEESHLLRLKKLASTHDMRIYVGAGGICKNAAKFSDKWGNAQEMLATGVRVAATLGSPVVNVRIGSIADRFLEGGIQPRIDEAVRVLRASRKRAKDAGVKFGFENHAADLRSEELLELIEAVGADVCGVMLDSGNGLWAMENPMVHLRALAPHVVCNSLRDYMIWESPEGATFQWTAVGDGLMDVSTYVQTLAKSNPGMPIFVESISNSARLIPFLTDEHWRGYPNLNAADIVDFLKLCRLGHPIEIDQPEPGMDKMEFDRNHQQAEFLKSIEYLRQHCSAGLKS